MGIAVINSLKPNLGEVYRDIQGQAVAVESDGAAQVYRVDVVQASITARAYLKYIARQQATRRSYQSPEMDLARTDFAGYNPPDSPLWRAAKVDLETINYRLLLLPVWMITLMLHNGLHRPAVVNGQTREAILASSFQAPDAVLNPRRARVEDMPLPPAPTRRDSVIRRIEPPRSQSVICPLKRR